VDSSIERRSEGIRTQSFVSILHIRYDIIYTLYWRLQNVSHDDDDDDDDDIRLTVYNEENNDVISQIYCCYL
jgi:hypothetical protein